MKRCVTLFIISVLVFSSIPGLAQDTERAIRAVNRSVREKVAEKLMEVPAEPVEGEIKIADNIFYNYLKCALKNYRDLVQIKRSSLPPYIEGQKLYDFLQNSNVTKEQRVMIIHQINELLDKMGKYHNIPSWRYGNWVYIWSN